MRTRYLRKIGELLCCCTKILNGVALLHLIKIFACALNFIQFYLITASFNRFNNRSKLYISSCLAATYAIDIYYNKLSKSKESKTTSLSSV